MKNGNRYIEKIFKENYKELCTICFYYLEDIEEAEDVVQDVFVDLIKKDKFKIIDDPNAYLKVAVRNSAFKLIAKKKKERLLEQELSLMNQPDEEESNSGEEINLLIKKELEKLPPQCRRIFMMCVVEGQTYPDVAEALNISVNTVKTQVKRAYKKLRTNIPYRQLSPILIIKFLFF
ncbi:RNA polymerase sigma-70 factor, ECF subfamily [Zunongwangia mangrovi]|uniref:RNA polymerase sigma-70 factor, ECF subfamily n=1 Tax=Zunongwangia mangrovi TaxID=1334022 RepID=A0A1I1N3A0_9FLAO|nr:RNA polymerase sigma-70 factor [Zunongwangia mangrovi]SFC92134.1 RNA polymerase sigma-70 factor, ECF subfamily [Zunongwangia mangrovi]